jgi:signal transduction histidine kinase
MKGDKEKNVNLEGSDKHPNPAKSHRQLRLVTEISKQISLINNPQELCMVVVNMLQNLLDYEFVRIWSVETSGEALVLEAAASRVNISPETRQLDSSKAHHPVVQAWRSGSYCVSTVDAKSNILAIPIMNLNDTIAILEIQQGCEEIADDDDFFLEILVNQISAGLRNACLFMELEKAKEEAELATRLKSQFLAGISATVRAPLKTILNWGEFMQHGWMGKLTKEQAEFIRMILGNTELVLEYINDGLDISRIKVGKALLCVEELSIAELLADSLEVLVASVGKKPIRIETEIAPDMPRIRGDQRRLEQIFLSLVSLSLKMTREGTIRVKAYHENGKALISIKDTGEGIPPEDYGRVFQDSQSHDGMTSGYSLGTTKQLVEAHRGKIWFESEVNKGTCFYLELLGVECA